jgi:hypothetical protein
MSNKDSTFEISLSAAFSTSSTVMSTWKELPWLQKLLWELENKKEKLCWNPINEALFPIRLCIQKLIFERSLNSSNEFKMNASFTGEIQRAWLSLLVPHNKINHFSIEILFNLNNLITSRYASLKSSTKP